MKIIKLFTVFSIIGGYLFSDIILGIYHHIKDTYFSPFTPVIGKLMIWGSRLHHINPEYVTKIPNVKLIWESSTWTFLWMGFLFYFFGPNPFLITVFIFLSLNDVIHKYAHMDIENRPKIITMLQNSSLLQSAAEHASHHTKPHDKDYCPNTPWINPILEKIWFWELFEKLVFIITKISPRSYRNIYVEDEKYPGGIRFIPNENEVDPLENKTLITSIVELLSNIISDIGDRLAQFVDDCFSIPSQNESKNNSLEGIEIKEYDITPSFPTNSRTYRNSNETLTDKRNTKEKLNTKEKNNNEKENPNNKTSFLSPVFFPTTKLQKDSMKTSTKISNTSKNIGTSITKNSTTINSIGGSLNPYIPDEEGRLVVRYQGKTYDITDYVNVHPGGEKILKYEGRDVEAIMKKTKHPQYAFDVFKNLPIIS